jgi:acyl-CoA dehydrogenase
VSDLTGFRAEVRAWLEANAPAGVRHLPPDEMLRCWGGRRWVFRDQDQRLWLERMVERGWTVPTWPVACGGAGLSDAEAAILNDERDRIGAAPPLYGLGIWMLGPALLRFGTEAQKREHLPKIARGEIRWAQGYSEPGAGSDLASLQTKGEDLGEAFLVNGSKTWTSHGDACDWIFALVRTEPDGPKHHGISLLLIDMDDPGVTTRPIRLMAGDSPFTETVLTDVRVPKANLVGERGRGWDVTKYLLRHERQLMAAKPLTSMGNQTLADRARTAMGDRLHQRPGLRTAIAEYELQAWCMEIALERAAALGDEAPATDGSVLKLHGSELNRRRSELLMTIDGYQALVELSESARDWLHAPAYTIAGGTSEIQLNIIAKRALDLPSE